MLAPSSQRAPLTLKLLIEGSQDLLCHRIDVLARSHFFDEDNELIAAPPCPPCGASIGA